MSAAGWRSAADVRRGLIRGELRRTRRELSALVGKLGSMVESEQQLEPSKLRATARDIALLAMRVRDLAHEHGTLTEVLTDP